jgi:prevent-host-death family protein
VPGCHTLWKGSIRTGGRAGLRKHGAIYIIVRLTAVTADVAFRLFLAEDKLQRSSFMVWVSIEEIQRDLSAYLQRVEAGETLVIVQAGQPVAEVKPIGSGAKALRPFGLRVGEFIVPDDFDAPLPEDILKAFEGQ